MEKWFNNKSVFLTGLGLTLLSFVVYLWGELRLFQWRATFSNGSPLTEGEQATLLQLMRFKNGTESILFLMILLLAVASWFQLTKNATFTLTSVAAVMAVLISGGVGLSLWTNSPIGQFLMVLVPLIPIMLLLMVRAIVLKNKPIKPEDSHSLQASL